MRIYPAPHYTMGGLWVDYNLMSTVPGLFVIGEANFSDHGANRLGASALMQGLADGYFVLPATICDYLASVDAGAPRPPAPEFATRAPRRRGAGGPAALGRRQALAALSSTRRSASVMWDQCGMSRTEDGLRSALRRIPSLREEFWSDLRVTGDAEGMNAELERAGRVADFLEFGELMCRDALERDESCGGHFREEHQTEDGEAVRDDENFSHVASGRIAATGPSPCAMVESLAFDEVRLDPKLQVSESDMNFTLRVWRQRDAEDRAASSTTRCEDIAPSVSFLEMLDLLNERLVERGEAPIAFDHDCREGICGMCSLTINGVPHGGKAG